MNASLKMMSVLVRMCNECCVLYVCDWYTNTVCVCSVRMVPFRSEYILKEEKRNNNNIDSGVQFNWKRRMYDNVDND